MKQICTFKILTIKKERTMKEESRLSKNEKSMLRVKKFCLCFMEVLHLNKHVNNNIQSVLQLLIRVSELKGPGEQMSYIYAYFPYIKVIVEEKSEDFMYHSRLLREFQENMDNYFDKLDPEVDEKSIEEFDSFIKEEGKLLEKELEMYMELEKIFNKTTHV
jgi:hypothetical protein